MLIQPTRIDVGPGGLWLSLSGPVDPPASSMPAHDASLVKRRFRFAGAARMRRFTLWATDARRDDWRRLRVAALWRTHRVDLPHE